MISEEFTFMEQIGDWEIIRTQDENAVTAFLVFWIDAQVNESAHESLADARAWCKEHKE